MAAASNLGYTYVDQQAKSCQILITELKFCMSSSNIFYFHMYKKSDKSEGVR